VSPSTLQANELTSDSSRATAVKKVALVFVLALAAFLRLERPGEVQPGIHDNEIINAQIVDELRAGISPEISCQAGEGRQGLYQLLLLAGRGMTYHVPEWYRVPSVVCSLATIVLAYLRPRRPSGPWAGPVAGGRAAGARGACPVGMPCLLPFVPGEWPQQEEAAADL
jgi:hypothetical protein